MNNSLNLQPDHLEDSVTKLLPLKESDFDRLFMVAADPRIWEQHPAKDRYQKETFQLFFNSAVTSKSAFLIIDSATRNLIGSTRYYDHRPAESSIAIGYTFLATAYWGGHHNRSSKKLLLDYAFQFVDVVRFHIATTNLRSQKATEKIGAHKMSVVDFDLNGVMIPHFEYEIRKSEWYSAVSK